MYEQANKLTISTHKEYVNVVFIANFHCPQVAKTSVTKSDVRYVILFHAEWKWLNKQQSINQSCLGIHALHSVGVVWSDLIHSCLNTHESRS